ncbi:MAG: MBL fold metallo-hydrolase [Candidatus Shapirobacteria bacterium]|jgi:competence protein ComEC
MKKRKFKIYLLALYLMILGIYLSIPDGKMRLIFCDVGQGDGVIIIRGNWQMLVDTGADNGKMVKCLDKYVPFWDKKIEGVMISHWDKDHSGALESIIKSYKIENLFESLPSDDGIEKSINTYKLKAGETIKYGEMNWEILSPGDGAGSSNENSLVAVLNYDNKKFMFTGDADMEAEGKMMTWWNSRVDGLKVAHHGADTSSSLEWLEVIRPAIAVISVGKNNSYGHPKQTVLDNLNLIGTKIFRTDKEGDIILGWKN